MDEDIGLAVAVPAEFDQAVLRARVTLRAHGFGILSEMPVPPRIGGEGRQHLFMCVWQRIIDEDNLGGIGLDVGDHFPCNFVIFEEGGACQMAVLDPTEGLEGWGRDGGAQRTRRALEEVLQEVASGETPDL